MQKFLVPLVVGRIEGNESSDNSTKISTKAVSPQYIAAPFHDSAIEQDFRYEKPKDEATIHTQCRILTGFPKTNFT